jgi:hypothetical protein
MGNPLSVQAVAELIVVSVEMTLLVLVVDHLWVVRVSVHRAGLVTAVLVLRLVEEITVGALRVTVVVQLVKLLLVAFPALLALPQVRVVLHLLLALVVSLVLLGVPQVKHPGLEANPTLVHQVPQVRVEEQRPDMVPVSGVPKMGNFKNAKEFDREPLRKSDFYQKVLKPTSGKSLGERWAGRRQSEHVSIAEDDPITKIIKAEAERMRPEPGLPSDQPMPRQETKVTKKQDKPKKKTVSQRSNLNSQVTPGKWTTK